MVLGPASSKRLGSTLWPCSPRDTAHVSTPPVQPSAAPYIRAAAFEQICGCHTGIERPAGLLTGFDAPRALVLTRELHIRSGEQYRCLSTV